MQVKEIMNNVGKFVREHDNTICAVAAAVGVVATVGLTIKATLKTKEDLDILEEEYADEENEEEVKKEKIKKKAKILFKDGWYVVVSAAGTIIFMLASHKLSLKKIKAGFATAGYWREAYVTYKDKVKEKLGTDAEKDISAEVAKEKYEENFDPNVIYQIGKGQVLYMDPWGRLFRSSIQEFSQEIGDFNTRYFDDYKKEWACLNDICDWVGLPQLGELGKYLGVHSDWRVEFEINHSMKGPTLPTGETATVLDLINPPVFENGQDLRDFRYVYR